MLIFGFSKMWYVPNFHANRTAKLTSLTRTQEINPMRQMALMLLIWSRSFLSVMPHNRSMMIRQIYK